MARPASSAWVASGPWWRWADGAPAPSVPLPRCSVTPRGQRARRQRLVGAAVALLVPFIGNVHNTGADLDEEATNLPRPRRPAVRAGGGTGLTDRCARRGVDTGGFHPNRRSVGGRRHRLRGGVAPVLGPPVRAKRRPVVGLLVCSQVVALPFMHGVVTAGPGDAGPNSTCPGRWPSSSLCGPFSPPGSWLRAC